MTIKDAKQLYFDSARFWLARVKQTDAQTIEDVLALMDWSDEQKDIRWSARVGPMQVHASAQIRANVILGQLELRRNHHAD